MKKNVLHANNCMNFCHSNGNVSLYPSLEAGAANKTSTRQLFQQIIPQRLLRCRRRCQGCAVSATEDWVSSCPTHIQQNKTSTGRVRHASVCVSSSSAVGSESCWLPDWMYIGSWNNGWQQTQTNHQLCSKSTAVVGTKLIQGAKREISWRLFENMPQIHRTDYLNFTGFCHMFYQYKVIKYLHITFSNFCPALLAQT